MKFVRFLVLAALTSLPVLSLPAVGQQEIDPDHFDPPATKAAKRVTSGKVNPKGASLKHRQKSAAYASRGSSAASGTQQPKGGKRTAVVRETGE